MRPAWSLVLFTVLSGTGFGLAVAGTLSLKADLIPAQLFRLCSAAAFVLVAAGLFSSLFHLANPRNAWRAIVRVRTSWLSREALLALVFFAVQLAALLYPESFLPWGLGYVQIVVAAATVWCTGMIYASLKTISQWHHPLTGVNYLLAALAGGFVLLAAASGLAGDFRREIAGMAAFVSVLALVGKAAHFRRIGNCRSIRITSATGLSSARVKLLELGHTAPNFLTREFVYECPAGKLRRLRVFALAAGFLLPLALLCASVYLDEGTVLLVLASASMLAGLLAERWLFFAEARHVVRLYHGDESA